MKLENFIQSIGAMAITTAATPVLAQEEPYGYISHVDPAAHAAVFGVNVGINGLICGTVAAIERRDVLKDTAKCVFGAGVQYVGMELGMQNVPVLPGMSLRIVETGTSIIDNTLTGRNAFDKLYYEIGPMLFEIDTRKEHDHFNWYWRALPIAGLITNIAQENSFNIADTLSYQTFSFNTSIVNGADGYTLGNIMAYSDRWSFVRAHEFNHVLQYVRFRPFEHVFPNFLQDKAHWRIGEDILTGTMYIPLLVCAAAGEQGCGRRWWMLTEAESYIMQTADETSIHDFHQ